MTIRFLTLLAAGGALLAGCSPRTASVAEQDARDRESPLIRRALEFEQVGSLDDAIKAYEEVLLETPKLVSAHFHLALLLQDYRKDYMGAIYHYRQYEHLRPDSEKTALLRDRIRVCQQLLVAQLLSNGDLTVSRKQVELVGEIDALNKRLSLAEGEKATLKEQRDSLERLLAEQRAECDRLRRLLDKIGPGSSDETPRPRSLLPRLDPAGAALLAPPHAETNPPPPSRSSPSPTLPEPPKAGVPALINETDPATAHVPPPPVSSATRTYVVQPGDSVYRIAERVYGDSEQWKRIRDANKDRLGPGNQLRAGQVLVIP
jgi:LysM repeat protein